MGFNDCNMGHLDHNLARCGSTEEQLQGPKRPQSQLMAKSAQQAEVMPTVLAEGHTTVRHTSERLCTWSGSADATGRNFAHLHTEK